jgi:hypothetical protein
MSSSILPVLQRFRVFAHRALIELQPIPNELAMEVAIAALHPALCPSEVLGHPSRPNDRHSRFFQAQRF